MGNREQYGNKSGIRHQKGISKNLWISYTCINCGEVNFIEVGPDFVDFQQLLKSSLFECKFCHFKHGINENLPESFNWDEPLKQGNSPIKNAFWEGFFEHIARDPRVYYKQCRTCGRILPLSEFSGHSTEVYDTGKAKKQFECRDCKKAINKALNELRTREQLRKGNNQRLGDLFCPDPKYKEYHDVDEIFEAFNGKCFKTGIQLDKNDTSSWQIDHILPDSYLYPLTKQNSALLSAQANNEKKAKWPSEYYTDSELVRLSQLRGADLTLLTSREPIFNTNVDPNLAVKRKIGKARNKNLNKRVAELIKIFNEHPWLIKDLTETNKQMLGFSDISDAQVDE